MFPAPEYGFLVRACVADGFFKRCDDAKLLCAAVQLERVKRRYCEVPRIPVRSTVSGSVIFVTEHFFLSQTSAKTGARRRILTTASRHCTDCYLQRVRATKKKDKHQKAPRASSYPLHRRRRRGRDSVTPAQIGRIQEIKVEPTDSADEPARLIPFP